MATHAPMARVPFAPLDSSRLQQLASAKNRQNGIAAQHVSPFGKANVSNTKSVLSATKRPLEFTTFEDVDGENIDPAMFCSPSKKSKNDGLDKPIKPFTFSLSPSKSMPPPPTVPSRLTTPARANMSSPRAALTAPAGRSPKRKASGIHKGRRISAPFGRIDPPFSSRSDSSLPFSLDAALNGTFSKSNPKDSGATIQESMPNNWFFDIYEDTPEDEASNLMEHSTLTLDLSSDEEGSKKAKDDRGKENTPPEDYDAPIASRSTAEPNAAALTRVKKTDIIRQKVFIDEMDDGQRTPLSDLETEYFVPEGLEKDSKIIVDSSSDKSSSTSSLLESKNLFVTPMLFTAGSTTKSTASTPSKPLYDMPVVTAEGDVKGDIIVWEDSPASARSSSPTRNTALVTDQAKGAYADENTQPDAEEVL